MTDPTGIRDILERALAAPLGVKVTLPDQKAAFSFRHKCNAFRLADRRASIDMFPDGDPRRGISQFDILELRLRDATIFIERKRPVEVLSVEEL